MQLSLYLSKNRRLIDYVTDFFSRNLVLRFCYALDKECILLREKKILVCKLVLKKIESSYMIHLVNKKTYMIQVEKLLEIDLI